MMLLNMSMAAQENISLTPGTTNTAGNDNSTVTQTMTPWNATIAPVVHRAPLITIYILVLVAGSVGLVLMISILKANLRSWTSIALLNLILAHLIFLLTVPFRIYYYATGYWELGLFVCQLVSAMIHFHMHIVFIIYIILLTVNFLHHCKKMGQMEFDRKLHAVAVSTGTWCIMIIIIPIVLLKYGNKNTNSKCFDFEKELMVSGTNAINMVLSICTILTSLVLTGVLASILHSVIKKHGPAFRAHQEFWAQMKNVSLMLIIIICLVPYHFFRLHYLRNPTSLKEINEVFLAFTAFTCFDMLLLFSGKGICQRCGVC